MAKPIDDKPLDTELLSVFCRVVERKNFSKAAMHLGVAQPIVTRKIRKLEEQLGVPLFNRHNRGSELTQAGELLAARASGILLQLQQLATEVRDSTTEVQGQLSLGIAPSVGAVLGPHILECAANRWPRLNIEFVEAGSQALFKRVRDRDLALALLFDPPPAGEEVVAIPLLMERLHLVGPAGSLSGVKKVGVKDLAELPLVLSSRGQTVRNILEDAFAEHGLPLKPVHEANSMLLLKAMVLQKHGYAVLSIGSLAPDLASGRLVAVPISQSGLSLALTMVVSREHFRLRAVQLMTELIAQEVARLVARGDWPGKPQRIRNRYAA
jgi:LysR family transcriptional regulator, nitrogen assimilation regulatory protein